MPKKKNKKKNKKKLKEIKVDQIIPDEVEMTGDRRISIKKTAAVGFTKSSLMKTIADNGGEVSYIKDKGGSIPKSIIDHIAETGKIVYDIYGYHDTDLTEEKLIAIRDSMPSVDSLDGKVIPEDDEFNKHFKGAWC